MNSRQFLAVVIVALVAGAAGWALHNPSPAPEKTAAAVAPSPTPASVQAPSAQVAAPVLPPAPKSVAPTPPAVTTAAPTAPAPAAPVDANPPSAQPAPPELASAINDMGSMIQSGDFIALMENYLPPQQMAALTPEQKTFMESQIQQQIQTPQGQQQVKLMTQMVQALPGLTPTINSAGDHATYQVPTPAGAAPAGTPLPPTIPITFVKVDGRWYFSNGGM